MGKGEARRAERVGTLVEDGERGGERRVGTLVEDGVLQGEESGEGGDTGRGWGVARGGEQRG